MKALLLLAILAGSAVCMKNDGSSTLNTTIMVEELVRGAAYGLMIGMNLTDAGTCIKEMSSIIDIVTRIVAIVESQTYEFKTIAKLVNDFAKWFAAEWDACGSLADFGTEFAKYWSNMTSNFGTYILNVFLTFFTNFATVVNEAYWFVYYHSREEEFNAGNILGTNIYERFFSMAK